MHRSLALSVLLAAAALVGCAPSNPTLVIEGVLPLAGECTADPTATVYLLDPTLDTSDPGPRVRPLGIHYSSYFRVANRARSLFSATYPVRADPNLLQLQFADVTLLDVAGAPLSFDGLPNPFRVPITGTVNSAVDEVPGVSAVAVEVVNPQYGAALAGTDGRILVRVQVRGTTSGGTEIVSGPSTYPVTLCNGCLFRCAPPDATTLEIACVPGADAPSDVICP